MRLMYSTYQGLWLHPPSSLYVPQGNLTIRVINMYRNSYYIVTRHLAGPISNIHTDNPKYRALGEGWERP